MNKYEVQNTNSGHSFGVFEGNTPVDAIDACCQAAGYDSAADMAVQTGNDADELIAALIEDDAPEADQAWFDRAQPASEVLPGLFSNT